MIKNIAISVLAIIALLQVQQCSTKVGKIESLTNLLDKSEMQVEKYKTSEGEAVAKLKAIRVNNETLQTQVESEIERKLNWKRKAKFYAEQYQTLRATGLEFPVTIDPIRDTIWRTDTIHTVEFDTLPEPRFQVYPRYNIDFEGKWLTLKGTAYWNRMVLDTAEVRNKVTVSVVEKFNWFKPNDYSIFLKNSNPYMHTAKEAAYVHSSKHNRWGISLFAGVTFAKVRKGPVKFAENLQDSVTVTTAPAVGVGLTYDLIKIPRIFKK